MAAPEERHVGRRLPRRLLTIPALFLALLVVVALSPALVLGAVAVDVARAGGRRPSVRILVFAVAYLGYESAGVVASFWTWLVRPIARHDWLERNHRLQLWWTNGLVQAARLLLGVRLEVERVGAFGVGPLIVLSRHVSLADALLPARILGVGDGMHLRYVLTRGLQLDPCLDIVGHRLPNHFVDRGAADAAHDIAAIERLATGMGADDAVVIFPEGGLFTPERQRRAVDRLERGGSPRSAHARQLRLLLPPRPAGTLGLLRAAPAADVVVLAHRGFEPLGSLRQLWRAVPLDEPIRLRLVRHPRASIPDDEHERIGWLDEQWAQMDDWLIGEPIRAERG